ncbi:hypothetical protein F4604DRAFT_1686633 [Suillus subluteus]|nr:hypothetical protein F4604DRAFT_1686633 [Suillus subluteus]
MSPLAEHVKDGGKLIDFLHQSLPPGMFEDAAYQVMDVPLERMKIMIKGSVLDCCRDIVIWCCGWAPGNDDHVLNGLFLFPIQDGARSPPSDSNRRAEALTTGRGIAGDLHKVNGCFKISRDSCVG